MKTRVTLYAGIFFLASMSPLSAGSWREASVPDRQEAAGEGAKTDDFKAILSKLIRQDEYLDEALDMLDTASGRPGPEDLAALGVGLRSVAGNLAHISSLAKTEFDSIQPGADYLKYTNAILSYSRKVDRKAAEVSRLVAQLAAGAKKPQMRDAVAGGKTSGKKRGRKLNRILEEQRAMEKLEADAKALRGASRGLSAASKWLYIASK